MLKDWSSISFIMLSVLPFECNETASLGSWEGGGGGGGGSWAVIFSLSFIKQTHTHTWHLRT